MSYPGYVSARVRFGTSVIGHSISDVGGRFRARFLCGCRAVGWVSHSVVYTDRGGVFGHRLAVPSVNDEN